MTSKLLYGLLPLLAFFLTNRFQQIRREALCAKHRSRGAEELKERAFAKDVQV
jgi:hypothetical protein